VVVEWNLSRLERERRGACHSGESGRRDHGTAWYDPSAVLPIDGIRRDAEAQPSGFRRFSRVGLAFPDDLAARLVYPLTCRREDEAKSVPMVLVQQISTTLQARQTGIAWLRGPTSLSPLAGAMVRRHRLLPSASSFPMLYRHPPRCRGGYSVLAVSRSIVKTNHERTLIVFPVL